MIKFSEIIMDTSGLIPFEKASKYVDIYGYLREKGIRMASTAKAMTEFQSFNQQTTFFGINEPISNITISGTLGISNGYNLTNEKSMSQCEVILHDTSSIQNTIAPENAKRNNLSEIDKSLLTLVWCHANTRATIFITNDQELKKLALPINPNTHGSAWLLAVMTLQGFIPKNKATYVYRFWGEIDKQCVPRMSFKQILLEVK